jgi:hypothetical protein
MTEPVRTPLRVSHRSRAYDVVGKSWRVLADESVFDYEPGQSTATFTRDDMPGWTSTHSEGRRVRRASALTDTNIETAEYADAAWSPIRADSAREDPRLGH